MSIQNDKRYLTGKNFSGAKINARNMRASRAAGSTWHKCEFDRVNFDGSNFNNATFTECIFTNCVLQNSSFTGSRIVASSFYRCDLIQCDMASVAMEGAQFIQSRLEYSSFLEAVLCGVSFNECDLTGAHLLYAGSKDVDYTGSNLHNCSVKLGCPFFRGSTFDARQWSYMQALLSETRGNEDRSALVIPMVDGIILKATKKMMSDPDFEETF